MDSLVLLLDLKILEVHQHSGAEEKTLVGLRCVLWERDLEFISPKAKLRATVEHFPDLAGRAALLVGDIEHHVPATRATKTQLTDTPHDLVLVGPCVVRDRLVHGAAGARVPDLPDDRPCRIRDAQRGPHEAASLAVERLLVYIIIPFMFAWNCWPGWMPTGIWTWAMDCCIGATVAMVVVCGFALVASRMDWVSSFLNYD